MAINIDIKTYLARVVETERAIDDKRRQLAASSDPYAIATIQRTLGTLDEMLEIFRKTADELGKIKNIDSRRKAAAKRMP